MTKLNETTRYELTSKTATEVDSKWRIKDVVAFHYFNPCGLSSLRKVNDDRITVLVNAGHLNSGWHIASGSLNTYFSDMFSKIWSQKKKVTWSSIQVDIKMMEEYIESVSKDLDVEELEFEKNKKAIVEAEENPVYTVEKLASMTVADLKLMAKEFKVKNWWKLKKDLLAPAIFIAMPLTMKKKPSTQDEEHNKIKKETNAFISQGGNVVQLRPQRTPKRQPPTMASAEQNKRTTVKPKKVKSTQRKSRVKRVREDENIITLQSILEEIGLAGQIARKALRASGIEKPGKQWCWPKGSKELAKVTELMELTAGISASIKKSMAK